MSRFTGQDVDVSAFGLFHDAHVSPLPDHLLYISELTPRFYILVVVAKN
jgi:hypothetical protein